ncbi:MULTISPECIES: ROK family transcriptional regulator [Glycomyces]|uniref:NBD/HSP70 family sugar kinase n=2 Tax=Glycomyces TaxID=58113 RepID=A0A9X3PGI5_9ACTN|nr:ROK family transcriptional regulator [Glycomyces lechevalierae]MDA1385071.1 ROK family transcriptional regulator [Glycomyces lechevalierae]MDR7337478.1 putative NBD/HSP70 family sugar kinase [Glycomyces lechevalierae]
MDQTSAAKGRAPAVPLSGLERSTLRELLIHGPKSRAEIARELGMSRASLTRVTRALIEQGLVADGPVKLRGATGRPSEVLRIRPEGRQFLGVKLTGDRLYAVVTDLAAQALVEYDEPLTSRSVEDAVAQIGGVCERLSAEYPGIEGAGIGLAGDVVSKGDRQIVLESPFLGWSEVPLADLVGERLGLRAAAENDVRALTAAEHWFGVGAGYESMVLIAIGSGIGVGIVVDGKVVTGANGRAGNLEHLPVDPSGPRCERGHRGCLVSYLANAAIVGALRAPGLDYAGVVELARGGDPAARQAFRDAGHALGVLVATLANTMNPEKIVITGDGIAVTELARDEFDAAIAAGRQPGEAPIALDIQPFEFSEWARAGAVLAIRDFLRF